MKKVGISLPESQLEAVEKIRKKERVPRSRVIQQALHTYLVNREEEDAVRAYVESYRKKPEKTGAAESYAKAAAEVLGYEDWS